MKTDSGIIDDIYTYDLTCSKKFMEIFHSVKTTLKKKKMNCEGDSINEKILSNIVYYVIPIFIKDKNRDKIKELKENMFKTLNHENLLCIDSYDYINCHKKWKSEYSLYKLCKKIFGNQTIYQYRPVYLKTKNGQLSYDVYLSKLHIAIEYQGKQHYEPINFFGGYNGFKDLQMRDTLKRKLSNQNCIILIEFNYKENITADLIKEKIGRVIGKEL